MYISTSSEYCENGFVVVHSNFAPSAGKIKINKILLVKPSLPKLPTSIKTTATTNNIETFY